MSEEVENTTIESEDKSLKLRVNQRYRAMSLVSEYFPMTLDNGAIVPGVAGKCPNCNKGIAKGLMRGEVRHAPAETFRVTAVGWCLDCDILFPYLFHIVPFGSDTFIIQPLDMRGWPEAYESKVLPFEQRKKKKRDMVVASSSVANSA